MPLSARQSYRTASAAAVSIGVVVSLKYSTHDPSQLLDFRHYVMASRLSPKGPDPVDDEVSRAANARPCYVLLDPPIMTSVSGSGKARYVEVTVAFRTAGKRDADLVQLHLPRLRSVVLDVLQDHPYEVLMTNSGREAARRESLRAVEHALVDQSIAAVINDVLFTTFAGQ